MPRKKRGERRWTDPVILVPIIVAVITAIVGPTYAYYYLQTQNQPNPSPSVTETPAPETPTETSTSESPTPPVGPSNSLSVRTDKTSYGFGDYVNVSGSVGKPVSGKTVRLDLYNSKGNVFQPFNDSAGGYVPQSDIQVRPDYKGQFSYRLLLGPSIVLEDVKGTYRVDVTYNGITKNATFTVR